jgi:DNA (cytosine-5)-methyltransferase 1
VSELRPRWCVIENVPGLLSSGSTPGADFGVVLRGLVDLGYGVAWRVLDARWFGVPQRRRRVFLVGCLGDQARAAQVLAVCESCGGYSPAGSEARQDVAYSLAASAQGTGDQHGNAWNTTYLPAAATLSAGGHPESNLPGRHHEDDENLIVASTIDEGMARPLVARATGYRMDLESETFVAYPLRAADGHHGWSGGRRDGSENLVYSLRSDADRRGEAKTPSLDAEGNVRLRDPGFNAYADVAPTLDGTRGHSVGPVADPISAHEQKTYTHEGGHNFRTHNLIGGVRRLTPLECERLQGFPDGWTELTGDNQPIADSHRYRMLGNAVATVVAQWLGHRLVHVDATMTSASGDPALGILLGSP